MSNPEKIQHFAQGMIDQVVNGLWITVKGRNRGEDDSTHFSDLFHVLDVT
jgi:hypothetical protein